MKLKLLNNNRMSNYLEQGIFSDKNFVSLNGSVLDDFPKIDIKVIIQFITFGEYQIKQSHGYLAEHFKKNGKYLIKVTSILNEKEHKVLLALIQSRHKNSTKYIVFISYVPYSTDPDSINGWACNCHSGLRTVGCCSHIACLIYFLSYAKYLNKPLVNPGKRLNNFLVHIGEKTNEKFE